jgi:hypothetical protein
VSEDLTRDDIDRCAKLLLARYGAHAASRAGSHAVGLRALGSEDAAKIWFRVKAAIERLQASADGD